MRLAVLFTCLFLSLDMFSGAVINPDKGLESYPGKVTLSSSEIIEGDVQRILTRGQKKVEVVTSDGKKQVISKDDISQIRYSIPDEAGNLTDYTFVAGIVNPYKIEKVKKFWSLLIYECEGYKFYAGGEFFSYRDGGVGTRSTGKMIAVIEYSLKRVADEWPLYFGQNGGSDEKIFKVMCKEIFKESPALLKKLELGDFTRDKNGDDQAEALMQYLCEREDIQLK